MPTLKSFALLSTAMLVAGTSVRARQSQLPVVDVSVPSLNDSGSSEIRGFGLIKFNGVLTDQRRRPLSGVVGFTVAIYRDRDGGAPLWQESQNVLADSQGNYTVLLGATTGEGIPPETFSSNEPRWLSVTPNVPDSGEQPRVLFVSVAHALKAADADTLGGKPVSEFVLRDSSGDNANGSASLDHAKTSKDRASGSNTAALTQTGTVAHFAKYVNGSDLGETFMVESSGGDIGTGAGRTSPPDAALDVLGPPWSWLENACRQRN